MDATLAQPAFPPSRRLLLFMLTICLCLGATEGSWHCDRTWRVSVDDFGAAGDGSTNDTQAFVDAWNAACSSTRSKAVLEVPAGKVYLVTPVNFSGPCSAKLRLSILGTIIAPSDPDVWGGLDPNKWLYFHGVDRMVVAGGGTVDGSGHEWWARSCKRNKTNPCQPAPKAVTFHQCKHLTVRDLTLANSQKMHLWFAKCSHVRASRLTVTAPASSPNTDGIHVSASTSVLVEKSIIRTGDDCISIAGNCSKVRVRHIDCGPGHGISIGSLGKAGVRDRVHNVRVENCMLSNTTNGLRIKTWQGGSGYARKIFFKNIMMTNVSNPIIINQYYCDSPTPCQNQTMAVKIEQIYYVGIKGTSATKDAVKFACSDRYPCKKLYMENIHLSSKSGGEEAAYCWKASGYSRRSVDPPSCLSTADDLIGQNVDFDGDLL